MKRNHRVTEDDAFDVSTFLIGHWPLKATNYHLWR